MVSPVDGQLNFTDISDTCRGGMAPVLCGVMISFYDVFIASCTLKCYVHLRCAKTSRPCASSTSPEIQV